LQRWAGGDTVPAARIFGLMHGFESVLLEEKGNAGISQETQDKVEDLLADVYAGRQPVSSHAIKDRLRKTGVRESDARLVMHLCRLYNRFEEVVRQSVTAPGGRA